jgi:F0F1-type ATP synthase epsilon subunit
VAVVDGGFLSVEHDRVTVVSDRAALGTGSAAR